MAEDILIMIIKIFCINLLIYVVYLKMQDKKIQSITTILIIIFSSIIATIIYSMLDKCTNNMVTIALMCCIQMATFKALIKEENLQSLIINDLISNSIVYIFFVLATILEFLIKNVFVIYNGVVNILIIITLEIILIICLFKIKRIKKGFIFLKERTNKDSLGVLMVNISVLIVFIYCLFANNDANSIKNILIPFILLSIIMFIMIQKTLTLYYKQKLLARTIDDYKVEIEQKDKKIEELSEEKFKISKLNHEFYNRQKALEQKVNEFIKNKNLNIETAEELSPIKQIQNLSDEYSEKLENIKHLEKLSLTEIEEIDDMFKYMQAECKKNNIDFKLQVNGNIHHLINKLIPQDRLVTLIGDHIRDAIIAVNSSNNKFRSIVTFIGIKDNYYEFSVYDTGIEFEIETLVNLGTKPITTHKDTGGTGIGFITTFETLKETKASLIIEEKHKEMDNDYTKAVNIKFDGKGEYRINSYRANEIKEKDKKGRIIIEK